MSKAAPTTMRHTHSRHRFVAETRRDRARHVGLEDDGAISSADQQVDADEVAVISSVSGG